MKVKDKRKISLVILILILFAINYPFLDRTLKEFLIESESVLVERVIDGDTIAIGHGNVRLLGINSPEKGHEYYSEAKVFLEKLVLNKTVRIEFGRDRYDRYNRTLAYIFLGRENIDLKLVEEGLANFYFPSGKDVYYDDFKNAWKECIKKNKNLCEVSKNQCAQCINLKEFDSKNQIIIFQNTCSFSCELSGWEIKDEGRKVFVFPDLVLKKEGDVEIRVGTSTTSLGETVNTLFWENEDYVWTKSGDTLFLRDEKGKLVLWRTY